MVVGHYGGAGGGTYGLQTSWAVRKVVEEERIWFFACKEDIRRLGGLRWRLHA